MASLTSAAVGEHEVPAQSTILTQRISVTIKSESWSKLRAILTFDRSKVIGNTYVNLIQYIL